MPGLGIGATRPRRRKKNTGPETAIISATVLPVSAPLLVGQALQDTPGWSAFVDPANYATSAAGETIASVTVNYIGDTASAAETFEDGDTNAFSLLVADTGGAVRTFTVVPRIARQAPPVAAGGLADQSFTAGTGLQTYDVSGDFTGAGLTFSVSAGPGISIDSATGLVSFDTDVMSVQAAVPVSVTATNSGGAAVSAFSLEVLAPVSYAATVTGLTTNATHGLTAEVGVPLTGVLAPLQGSEVIEHRWEDSAGIIAGAGAALYTPVAGQDLQTIRYAPTVDGVVVRSAGYLVRHAPPVAGSLAPVVETAGTGAPTVNLAAGFTGSDLAYSESVSWATISGSLLTIDDAVRAETLTITASNSGGSATVDLNVTINPLPVTLLSAIADQSFTEASGEVTIDLGTVFAGAESYAVSGSTAVSIDGDGVTLRLSDAQPVTADTVTVTGTNASGGRADDIFTLTVTPLLVQVAAPIADQVFARNSGDVTIDLRAVFQNATSYSVTGPSAAIDGDGFTLRLDDGALVADGTVTVTASNANNSVQDAFQLTITSVVETDLVMTIETTVPGEAFTLQTNVNGVYSGTVDMGDGSGPRAFSVAGDPAFSTTYPTPGIHTIRVSGQIGGLRFGQSAPDAAKVRTVENLGELSYTGMISAFARCVGLTSFTAGNTDTGAVANWYRAFEGCSSLTAMNLVGLATTSATTLTQMFRGCTNLASLDVTGFDTRNVRTMDEMFENTPAALALTLDVSGWNFESLVPPVGGYFGGAFNFLDNGKALSQAVYDATLQAMTLQSITPDVWFGFAATPFTPGGSIEADRTALINSGLNIEDAGNAPPEQMAAPVVTVDGDTGLTVTLAADPFTNGLPISSYDIRYSTDETNWTDLADITSPQAITGLEAGTLYYVQARAQNFNAAVLGGAYENWSASATATTEGGAGVSTDDVVTIAAGTVAEDMAGFPVYVDMSDLSDTLWSQLDADGGNLRATNATDDLSYPLDLVWIDRPNRRGTAFVRRDLQAAADVNFTLRARTPGTAAAAVTAPDGRNAVWADHLAVVLGPDLTTDRTGSGTLFVEGRVDVAWVEKARSPGLTGNQGLAWDGTHWYVTGTNEIKKYDAAWTLIDTNADPTGDTGISGVNHCGDPCIIGGELFIPVETYPNSPYDNQHICVFNTADLSFNRSFDISAQGREISGFALDPVSGDLFVSDYTDGSSLMRYNVSTGAYIGTLALSDTVSFIQGLAFSGGKIYVSSTNDGVLEVQPDGAVDRSPIFFRQPSDGNNWEGLEAVNGDLYYLNDSTTANNNRVLHLARGITDDLIHHRRGRAGDLQEAYLRASPIPSRNVWTVSGTFEPNFLSGNQALLSVNNAANPNSGASRGTVAQRSIGQYSAWNNSNSWLAPGVPVAPTEGVPRRIAFAHNGTTERKVLVDGLPYATGVPTAARPGGTNMNFYIGAEDDAAGEIFDGYSKFLFFHGAYLSDNWLAAEHANLNSPATFYTVTGGSGGTPAEFSTTESGGEVVYDFPASDDPIAITIDSGPYAGTYTQDDQGNTLTGNLLTGRNTRLTRPVILADGLVPNRLNVLPGLIVAEAPNQTPNSWQWKDDGVDIPGATTLAYDAPQATDGSDFTVEETDEGVTVLSDAYAFSFQVTVPNRMDAPSIKVESDTRVTLTRAPDPADNGSAITSYDLEYSTDGGSNWTTVPGFPSPYVVTGLTASQDFRARTRAVNGIGAGAYSDPTITRTAAGPAFDILAELGSAGSDVVYAYYDFEDVGTLYQAANLTAPVTADGQAVASVADISGKGRTINQNRANSAIWDAANTQIRHTALSNSWFETATVAGDLPSIIEVYVVLKTSDSRFMTLTSRNDPSVYIGAGNSGGGGFLHHNKAGSPVAMNGQYDLSGQTQADIRNAVADGTSRVLGIRNVDTGNFTTAQLRFLNDSSADGLTAEISAIVVTGALTETQRTDLVSKLETKAVV